MVKKALILLFLFFICSFSAFSLGVSWNSEDLYDSLPTGEAFVRVKEMQSTYDYNSSSSNNYGKIANYASSYSCSQEPYSVIAQWVENLDESAEASIKKYQGACYTIARFNYNCPGDSLMVGVGSDWNPYNCKEGECEYYDRVFNFFCAFPKNTEGELLRVQNCTEHPYKFSEVDPEGEGKSSSSRVSIDKSLGTITQPKTNSTLTCPNNKILKGLKSWYNKENKDREFSISCCEVFDQEEEKAYVIDTTKCSQTDYSTSHSDYEKICSSSDGKFIYQINSKYLESQSDRTLNLNCCSLTNSL